MSVGEFFRGKYIFVTGGSGFIGKVLIEKLLRSCDGIEKIYVLFRNKKNKTAEERLKIILESDIFEKLRNINPEATKKVVPICGDVNELKLGINDEDTELLIENVDIIYHAAASVRFDESLKDSVLLNTRGTKEIIELALQAKKLVTFIHVSTAYCNSDKEYVEEKVYPAHADWRDTIKLAEEVDQHTLDIFSQKYIHPLANTYTFAKSLAEHVVNDLCKGKLITSIVRPSIVVPTLNDPIPGWTDNFNGPMGLSCGEGKGLLKILYGEMDAILDVIPVDIVVKYLILIAYQKNISKDKNEVTVYNVASNGQVTVSNRTLVEICPKLTWDAPYTKLLSYPSVSMTNNWYYYYFAFLLYHMIPAIIIDGLLKLNGKKPMLVKIQRKIYVANEVLTYFMRNTWTFVNDKCVGLGKLSLGADMDQFSFRAFDKAEEEDKYLYYIRTKIRALSLFKDEKFDRQKGFRNTLILWLLNYFLRLSVLGFLGWFLYSKIEILTIFRNYLNAYLLYLSEL